MPQNIIYTYLSLSANYQYLKTNTSSNNSRYYLLPLRQKKESVILGSGKELKLQNHHISVYEETVTDNFYLSPYHYTAEYKSGNVIYRLHVYFNLNGSPSSSAELKMKNGENYSNFKISSEDQEIFISLAINNSQDLMRRLFNEVNRLKKSLYEKLNSSKDINEKLRIIEQLVQYDPRKRNHLSHVKKQLFINIAIEKKRFKDRVSPIVHEDRNEHNNFNSLNVELESSGSSHDSDKTDKRRDKKIKFQNELDEFFKNEEVIGKLILDGIDENNIDKFYNLFQQTSQYYLLLEDFKIDESYELKLGELSDFCEKNIAAIVLNLLLLGKYKLAKYFKNYYEDIFENIFNVSLSTDNSDLLDHILKNYPVDINNLRTSEKLGSENPLVYCYKNNKLNTLYTLINNKASILISSGDNELPLAFHLLNYYPGIYYSFIYKNFEGVKFFNVFSNLLNIYIKNKEAKIDRDLLDKIEKIKVRISKDIANINNLKLFFPNNYIQVINQFHGVSTVLLSHLDSSDRIRLLKIPRFSEISNRLELAITAFFDVYNSNKDFVMHCKNIIGSTFKLLSSDSTLKNGKLGVCTAIFAMEFNISFFKALSNPDYMVNIANYEFFKKIILTTTISILPLITRPNPEDNIIMIFKIALNKIKDFTGEEKEPYFDDFITNLNPRGSTKSLKNF